MVEYKYNIIMQTPLGEKKGDIYLNINLTDVSGYLNIIGNKNVITGKVESDGKCHLSGRIETMVSIFEYSAKGYIDEEKINLILYTEKEVLNISGIAYKN